MSAHRPESCLLCTYSRECVDSAPLVLFATTPILHDLLKTALLEGNVAHQNANGLFLLDRSVSDDQLKALVKVKLSTRETDDIRVSRARGAALVAAESLTQWLRHTDTAWFDQALEQNLFTSHFQPIVDVKQGRVHGHECLVRLFTHRAYNGGEIMEAAVERGRTHIFDSYTRRLSVKAAAAQHVPGTKIFINFLPSSIYDPAFCMKSTFEAMQNTQLQPSDIVFEVVESERVHDPVHLKKICTYYRQHGFGFALDDVGTGANSLQMVCDLRPDYIKIDKSLIWGVENPMYRSTIAKISELASEFGVSVIAEGVENASTADTCIAAGIHYMQGYYFARPAAEMVACSRDLINLAAHVEPSQRQVEVSPQLAPASTT